MRSYFRKDLVPRYKSFTYPIKSFSDFDAGSNEDNLPLSHGVYGYNVRIKDGKLRQGLGIDYVKIYGSYFPTTVSLGYLLVDGAVYRRYDYVNNKRDDMFIAQLSNGKIYYMRFSDWQYVYSGIQITPEKVTFLNYHDSGKDLFLIMTKSETSYMFDGSVFSEITAPPSVWACVHGTRVFSVNGANHRLSYSKALDPKVWTVADGEGGYVNFPDEGGALTGVISWKNCIYVFREYAVHKITAYVDDKDFVVSKVFDAGSYIYMESVAVCNGTIVFLTDDGFYSFDGYIAKKVMRELFPLIKTKSVCRGAYFGNKYHISADLVSGDEIVGDEKDGRTERNGIISHDLVTGETNIFRGADVRRFVYLNLDKKNELLFVFNGNRRGFNVGAFSDTGRLFESPLGKLWRSPYTDLGSIESVKVLKRIFIRTKEDIKLTLKLDKKYPIDLVGGEQAKMIPVNRRAERVGMEISTDSDFMDVNGILMEFDFIRRLPDE